MKKKIIVLAICVVSLAMQSGTTMKSYFKSLSTTQSVWKITLNNPNGETSIIYCPDDMYILDAAEAQSVYLPYAARAGVDAVSGGRLISGTVDQSAQSFLDTEVIEHGYVLLDVAYPLSDCVINTHLENEIMEFLFNGD